jgi:hypothetical protein
LLSENLFLHGSKNDRCAFFIYDIESTYFKLTRKSRIILKRAGLKGFRGRIPPYDRIIPVGIRAFSADTEILE